MLDHTFAALADPTRRAILARLSAPAGADGLSVGAIARPLPMSLPAVVKHLNVLTHAGLVTRTRAGRTVTCRISTAPLDEVKAWLDRHARFWAPRLDRLAAVAEGRDA